MIKIYASLALIILILIFGINYFFYKVPKGFNPETVVHVSKGEGLTELANQLKDQHIITSPRMFVNVAILFGGERKLALGDYIFHKSESLASVVRRFINGDYQLTPITITIPEGSSSYDIAEILAKKFASFNPVTFLELTKDKEGYLFPDTYYLYATIKPEDIVVLLQQNFNTKIEQISPDLASSTHSLKEVLTMASILEAEGKTVEDRKIIAGILWRRLNEGMLLQIDTPFKYINGKTSEQLTLSDLKVDSPYNTYRYKGLPPTPISNPGIESIQAALHPTASSYYFFISDKEGNMHYAKTFKEHQQNVKKYLGK